MSIPRMLFRFLFALFQSRLELAAENLALRQQLAILQRTARRPKLRQRDRIFWVWGRSSANPMSISQRWISGENASNELSAPIQS